MNKYWVIAMLVSFVAWSDFMYYEGFSKEHAVCGVADAKHDLAQSGVTVAAQNAVIATVGKQQTITQGVDYDYQHKKSYIDSVYASNFSSVQPEAVAALHSLPAVANTASRPHAATARPFRTAFFRLSPQECDDNTEQLYSLQSWVKSQQAVKQPSTK